MKHRYTVQGEPLSITKLHVGKRRMWDISEQELFVRRQDLTNQHNSKPFFNGPLKMTMVFYFMTPSDHPSLNGKAHTRKPPIERLFKFLHHLGEDILYAKDTPVAEISCKKIYDYQPRTELVIIKE